MSRLADLPSHVVLSDPQVMERIYAAIADPGRRLQLRLMRDTALTYAQTAVLRRRHCYLDFRSVVVVEELAERRGILRVRSIQESGGAVSLPAALVEELRTHLEERVGPNGADFVFAPQGRLLSKAEFERCYWRRGLEAVGLGDTGWGLDCLAAARLRGWMQESQSERRAFSARIASDINPWEVTR